YAAEHRLMLSMTVDSINEKLMDEIGDTVLEWEGDTPAIIEDYREDIRAFYEQ
ncbi:MAG: tellurite resistance TerB C-terminal domain-containing protein, partial [Lachnospira sp.]|nr:tellurite resistance TerB C-terminal domain-containing protein [Lachnospira sp.]